MEIKTALEKLRELGLSDYKIADLVKTSQPTIHRLRTGKHTRTYLDTGLSVIKLLNELKPDHGQDPGE